MKQSPSIIGTVNDNERSQSNYMWLQSSRIKCEIQYNIVFFKLLLFFLFQYDCTILNTVVFIRSSSCENEVQHNTNNQNLLLSSQWDSERSTRLATAATRSQIARARMSVQQQCNIQMAMAVESPLDVRLLSLIIDIIKFTIGCMLVAANCHSIHCNSHHIYCLLAS